jgi:type IV secretory pathway TraG/TraD family ATPase VirD4
MNDNSDFHIRAHGLWLMRLAHRQARFRFFLILILGSAAVGAVLWTQNTVPPGAFKGAGQFGLANALVAIGDMFGRSLNMNVRFNGQTYVVAANAIANDPWFRSAWAFIARGLMLGGLAGLAFGSLAAYGIARTMRSQGHSALGDRVLGGTRIVPEQALAKMTDQGAARALHVGSVAIPPSVETRHFAMVGTTGSGKTTVLRQMLDGIEARGEAALVYDTSGEFVAHYYRPERGDIILNPFDERCAFWSPFDEIAHPADADRIAHQLVSETGSNDDDVWLETSRILVANMLRTLWAEGNGTLEALLDALQMRTKEHLKQWLGNTSSARTFADDADRATGSVLFMLAKAANLIQFLRADGSGGQPFAFRQHIAGLDAIGGAKPWIFVPRKEDYFEASKPVLACWLECAASAVLGLPPSPSRRVWFVLDELADLPRVENLSRLLPEGRKFGAAIVLTFQALGQMRHRYGPPIAEAMLACCNTKLFLQTVDRETRVWASETIGECEVEMRTASDVLTPGASKPQTTLSTVRHIRAAVIESDLRLPKYQGFLLFPDGMPVARIGLTDAHIRARGAAVQPGFIAAAQTQTLWSRMARSNTPDEETPGLV